MSQPRAELTETGFPPDFIWGAATAAYQIEGAVREDGRGETIWDRFSHTPGKTANGETGDVACDHYHLWQDDLRLFQRLNLNAYRFSIAWSRILPEGRGRPNAAGLDFYEQLVDRLLSNGIRPFVTLYHWDLPQSLEDRGGWRNRDTAGFFADYADIISRRLGDRVSHWITLNEPHIVVIHGHVLGLKAPGLQDRGLIAPVAHHLLLAHGLAVAAIRAQVADTQVGITLNIGQLEPGSDREDDIEATRFTDGLYHRWYLDPLYRGTYPEDVESRVDIPADLIRPGDLTTIAAPLDFLGVNYYSRSIIRAGRPGSLLPITLPPPPPPDQLTEMGWEVYPKGLYDVLVRLAAEYPVAKLYITENGAAFTDHLDEQGEVHDATRVRYLSQHFQEARRALLDGVPLRGYFVWSLLDNFEWSYGYRPRFGLVYVDYPTQQRTIKDSGYFVGRVAATNGGSLDE
ncbi:MAG: GH1 family beta-glucosidase [Ktedonobacterales bacterium]